MEEKEIEALQAAAAELEKIKEQNRIRARRFLDRRAEAGKRQISAIVHIDVYEEINRRRDRSIQADEPLTAGQIIEQALLATKDFVKFDGKVDIDYISDMSEAYDKALTSSSVNIDDNTKEDIQEVLPEPVKPPYPNKQIDLINGDVVVEVDLDQVFKDTLKEYKTSAERAEALNRAGVKRPDHLKGDTWTPENVRGYQSNLINREKRAAKSR